ncbi:MAG: phage tail assembly protein [Chromatiales bacterium]|nr:phage tail assembly protein [Gammaproteobacteria bacterium]
MSEFKLKYPVTVDGEEITSLNLRRVNVLDLEVMEKQQGQLTRSVTLLSQVSERSPDVIRQMDAADFNAASDLVADFLEYPRSGSDR